VAEKVSGRTPDAAELELWRRARAVAAQAYARYSGLHVGAALRSPAGAVYLGVNVENASYPAGLCAERAALAAAVTAGERRFSALAVATEENDPLLPCGACLQALAEFGELDIVAVLPESSPAGDTTAAPGGSLPGVSAHAPGEGADPGEPRVVALNELLRAPFHSPRDRP
jgi:cytidine deaminase